MTPPELMLSALGCCAMHYATEYLRTRRLPFDSTELRISATTSLWERHAPLSSFFTSTAIRSGSDSAKAFLEKSTRLGALKYHEE